MPHAFALWAKHLNLIKDMNGEFTERTDSKSDLVANFKLLNGTRWTRQVYKKLLMEMVFQAWLFPEYSAVFKVSRQRPFLQVYKLLYCQPSSANPEPKGSDLPPDSLAVSPTIERLLIHQTSAEQVVILSSFPQTDFRV